MLIFFLILAPLVRLFGKNKHLIFAGISSVMPTLTLELERENIKKRQAQGIAAAKARGVKFGRPVKDVSDEFEDEVGRWNKGELNMEELLEKYGMSQSTFYRRVRELDASKKKKGR